MRHGGPSGKGWENYVSGAALFARICVYVNLRYREAKVVKKARVFLSLSTAFFLLSPIARATGPLADSVCSAGNLNSITAADISGFPYAAIPLPNAPLAAQAPLVITVPGLKFETLNWGKLSYELFSELASQWFPGLRKGPQGTRSAASEAVIRAAYAEYNEQLEPFREAAEQLPESGVTRAEPDNYLEISLAQAPSCSGLTVVPFAWSRNPADTAATVKRFVPMLIQAYDSNRGSSRPVYVLTHSWGSVIMHEVLNQVALHRPDIKVDKFFTLGSPLVPGNFIIKAFSSIQYDTAGLDKNIRKPANVRYWRNVWAGHDYFSNAVKAADVNVQADASVGAPESELAYNILHGLHIIQAKDDLLTLFNLRSWHASYYRDYDAYLKSLDRHIRLVIFNPEVAAPLVSPAVK